MIRLSAALAAAILVSACAEPHAPLAQPPVAVTPTDPAAIGLDVYSEQRKANPTLPAYQGETQFVLRTYVDPPGNGNRAEVSADCKITGGTLFTAEGKTPLALVVPNYGQHSLSLGADCKGENASGSDTHAPYNITMARVAASTSSAASSGGLIGALVGVAVVGVINATNDPSNDEFGYADWAITLK